MFTACSKYESCRAYLQVLHLSLVTGDISPVGLDVVQICLAVVVVVTDGRSHAVSCSKELHGQEKFLEIKTKIISPG